MSVKNKFFTSLVLLSLTSSVVLAQQNTAELPPLAVTANEKKLKIDETIQEIFDGQSLLQAQDIYQLLDKAYYYQDSLDTQDFANKKGRYQQSLKLMKNLGLSVEQMIEKIKNGEFSAIQKYTEEIDGDNNKKAARSTQWYSIINSYLYNKEKKQVPLSTEYEEYVTQLDNELKQLPLLNGFLLRGTAYSEEQLKQLENKMQLSSPAYLSTSLDIGDAVAFRELAFKSGKKEGKIRTLLILKARGHIINVNGEFAKEEEVLISRNSLFSIKKIYQHEVEDDMSGDKEKYVYIFAEQN